MAVFAGLPRGSAGLMLDGRRKSMQPMAALLGVDHQQFQTVLDVLYVAGGGAGGDWRPRRWIRCCRPDREHGRLPARIRLPGGLERTGQLRATDAEHSGRRA